MSVSGCNCKGLLLLDYYVRQPVYNVVPKRNVFSHSTTCPTEFAWKKETGQGRTGTERGRPRACASSGNAWLRASRYGREGPCGRRV